MFEESNAFTLLDEKHRGVATEALGAPYVSLLLLHTHCPVARTLGVQAMKTLVTALYSDWDPNLPQEISPALFDLSQEKTLLAIVLMLANGIVAEVCFDSETADGLALIRSL